MFIGICLMYQYDELVKVSANFWTTKNIYPEYGTIKQRRLFELNYLVPRLKGNSILDLGCGDGALINCLLNLTEFKEFYAYDWAEDLMRNISPSIKTEIYDCNNPKKLPKVDIIVFAGVLPFIFNDEKVVKLFECFDCKEIFLRAPCSLNTREVINTYSDHLKEQYASVYRTTDEVKKLIETKFNLKETVRIYPDDIESQFGTKQFYFRASC